MIGLTLVDRFRLDRLIGTGGMAAVYQGTDLALGRTVAVKLFRLDTADDAGPQRQSGEVAVLASLNHFALVTLFDAGTEEVQGISRSFIVMEYIDGSDLRSRIRDGAVAAAEVARMGADLAEALHYVHAQGIIHRDIKPANVLLAPSDFPGRVAHAKLADFGIARLFDATHLTHTGAVLGTASYLSPEQALGEPIGPPSDVYSLGLVLLESLTAERSYPGTAIESAMARLQRQPSIPDALGPEWAAVLSGMTTRDPADRLRAADAAVRLRALVAAEPAAATDAPTELLEGAPTRLLPTPLTGAGSGAPDSGYQPTAIMPQAEPTPAVAPSAAPPTAATQRYDQVAAPAPAAAPARNRSRRPLVIGSIVVALLALAAVIFVVQPTDQSPPPPTYPAVDGDLGEHLRQLQESVNP